MELALERLEALAAAVSEGTFEAASRKLHVTPSAISQRVKALEVTTGRVLLVRAKPVRPTVSGAALLRAARQIEAVTSEALRELRGSSSGDATVISLAVNADSLSTWLLPALAAAGAGYIFDLRREDQERTTVLLREGVVMAAVTASASAVPGCTVTSLGRMRYRPRASADFAARWFPNGASASNFAQAPVVVYDREDRLQDTYLRRRSRRRLDPPRHYVPGSEAFIEAVRLGLGWGMVPDLQTSPHDAALVELDAGGATDVKLYWQQWRLLSAALEHIAKTVRDAAVKALR